MQTPVLNDVFELGVTPGCTGCAVATGQDEKGSTARDALAVSVIALTRQEIP